MTFYEEFLRKSFENRLRLYYVTELDKAIVTQVVSQHPPILRMIWIASSNLTNLSLIEGKGIPYANDSSSFQAAPIPMKSLPLLRTSRVAPIFAKIDGYRYIMPVIIVPNFILEVTPARTDMVVQLSSMGSSGFPTIGI